MMPRLKNQTYLFVLIVLTMLCGFSVGAREEAASKFPVIFESLEQLDELAMVGMPALALRLLRQEQKDVPRFTPEWYAFEQKHVTLLAAAEDWQVILERTKKLLNDAKLGAQITEEISQWFKSQQVLALLNLNQPEKALNELRHLLWGSNKLEEDSELIAFWRRLIIRAYLLMDSDEDAQKALLRYQQDYSSNHLNLNLDWRLLQARVLLRLNRPAEVVSSLSDIESHTANALRLVAAIRLRPKHASLYVKDAEKELAGNVINRDEAWAYHYVMYEAAVRTHDDIKASIEIRKLLAFGDTHSSLGEEFHVSGDKLWELYSRIGSKVGNHYKLLVGDDVAWYNKANNLVKDKLDEALGLYAVLAFNASDANKRQLAHKEIVSLLSETDDGLEVVSQLYLHSKKIKDYEAMPIEVRYRFVDFALSKGDITLAAKLMQGLKQPPEGQDVFSWRMRVARTMILEGKYEQGDEILRSAFTEGFKPQTKQIDHYLQVVFDLQTVGRHEQALELFDLLREEWLDERLRLELLYWSAESFYELKMFDQSAWSYLKSALLADSIQHGLWAQSARFKAAEALTEAHLFDDAQKIYTELLGLASTESRKTVIKQKLQHLRLLRNAQKSSQQQQG